MQTDTGEKPQSTLPPSANDGLPIPSRHYAMATIAISLTLALIDGSVANVALPLIAVNMHAGASTAIWVVNGYQLALAICLLPFAALGEKYGYRTVYKGGLLLFTLASLACSLSTSMTALTVSRIVQGVGAAGIMSVNTALIRYVVPRNKLGSALGVNSLVAATAATIGPTVAGAILSVASWPWLFAVNLPLGVVAITLARRNLPDNDRSARPFDLKSALLSAFTIGSVVTTVESLGHGLPWTGVLAQILICIVAGVLLVRREAKFLLPMFPLDLLRIPIFSLSLATSIGAFAAQMMAFVALPFFLHDGLGYAPAMVGLLMTPWPFMAALVSPIAGRLSDRIPPGLLGGIGLAALAVGLASLAFLASAAHPVNIVWRMMICGLGFGLFQSPNSRTLIGAAPRSRSGAASGMLGTARLTGQATGTAMVALMLAEFHPHGVKPALCCGAALASVACIVSLFRIRHFSSDAMTNAGCREPLAATADIADV